jgi:16S rRNA (adenine1518-N6/adenine1519-N6)-dimethyltransferase
MFITELHRFLKEAGITPNRKLGQSFLVNSYIASRIAEEVSTSSSVLEIGPGFGALTEKLLDRCGSLSAVEISPEMVDVLRKRFSDEALSVTRGDILSVNPETLPGFPFHTVTGNLPYSISSPILFRMLEEGFDQVQKAVLMLQREVAIRLSTLDGGKEYGKLALKMWPYYTVRTLLDADPEDFYPTPVVYSRVVVLERRSEPIVSRELFGKFRRIINISFSSRRKIILNNLTPVLGRDRSMEILARTGIDPGLRAEQIEPEMFVRLAENL